jgi:hypothetical protein
VAGRSGRGLGVRTVIVQVPGVAQAIELVPGELATFGRGDGVEVDIAIAGRSVSRLAGAVRACDDYWVISNHSSRFTYVVCNPEGAGEFVKVAPGRLEMPVPFEFADVLLPAQGGEPAFRVLAPQHAYADPDLVPSAEGEQTTTALPLDHTARYFLILVALCEPRLRDPFSAVIPTVSEIIDRLSGAGYPPLTRTAVNFHIEYLARHKLRVKPADGGGGKADWQRAALVSLALRFNLVNHQHLALLDANRQGDAASWPQRAGTAEGNA